MRLLLTALILAAMPAAAQAPIVSAPETQEGVSLTVYNGGFAVVREVRPITLPRGRALVRFEGVAAQIDPTSLALKSLTDPNGVTVREQNYQYALIGTNSVLDAAVGQRIRLTRALPDGRLETVEGTLISQPGQGRIVRLDDGRVLVDPQGTIELAGLPPGLLSRPSLLWMLDVERAATHRIEASYLTNGITWSADYVAVVQDDERQIDLTGWVTLNNQSGATYREAQLQLMAGEVRRVQDQVGFADGVVYERAMPAAPPPPPFQEEAFFEYHLYTLEGATTIAERETKQMTLLSAADVGVRRRLVFDGSNAFGWWRPRRPGSGSGTDELSAAVVVELENTEENHMGMPLPAGKVRVYKADARGNLQFLGEDRIQHTARNERVRLYIGDAFDVVGTRRVVDERRINSTTSERTVEVEVRNRKETTADVAVVERLWGDWRLTQQSHPHTELDAYTLEFPLTVAADETVRVRYTVRWRH
ncbi:MAG TPA: hypothetical protein VD962_03285 [Rubricoccaceae bacterium]|nr:hypothetical protein [Rubricoccaceae bacterium]